jgi:molybdopterin converting factor small subunit
MKPVEVTIKYLVSIADKTGRRSEAVQFEDGKRLRDLGDWLYGRYGLDMQDPLMMKVLNGKGWEQYPEKDATKLKDGDTVLLFPPIAGG